MKPIRMSLLLCALLAPVGIALADQSLQTALGLQVDQARTVGAIEAKYRAPFAAKRQERNSELRKLRRARLANDSEAMARHEATSDKLHDELRKIHEARNAEIRAALTPAQRDRFEQQLALNKEMKGSARDVKDL